MPLFFLELKGSCKQEENLIPLLPFPMKVLYLGRGTGRVTVLTVQPPWIPGNTIPARTADKGDYP